MPDLHLYVSERVRVSIKQSLWGRDAHIVIEWNGDGMLSEIHSESVTDETLVKDLWDSLHVGTTWHLPVVLGLIGHVMPKAFDKYWREMLKGMGKNEIIARENHEGIDNHLTLNPDGGMDSWLVKDGHAYHANYYHTIDDIIAWMWTIYPKIDGWVKVAKGDIYPSIDEDDEDTRELPVIEDEAQS